MESDIELLRHAAAMSGDSSALAVAQGQMSRLAGLQHRIEHAHGGGLAAIRAEVMASVAATQTMAQQARSTVANAQAAEVALHAASAAAHREVASFVHDFYERKIFDKYLDFASPEDAQAYREREETRRKAIEEARALGTPQGELLALRLSREQLEDAGRHGANVSPDYIPTLSAVSAAEQDLSRAIEQSAQSPAEARIMLQSRDQPAAGLVSPDIIESLRNAGVVPTRNDVAANVLAKVTTSDATRGLV